MFLRPPPSVALMLLGLAAWGGQASATLYPTHVDHPTGRTSIGVTVANFNGDLNPDLVVANVNTDWVTVLLGDGSGGIASSYNLPTGSAPRKIVTGDWDRNGSTDLAIVVGGSHALAIHPGNGNGTFGAPTFYGTATSSPSDLATGDFNGDGFADLAVAAVPVMILLGNGDGAFVLGESPGTGAGSIVATDLDGDAVLDLAMASRGTSTAAVQLGRGDGTFHPKVDYAVGREPVSIAAGDFNRDGRPDLITANRGGAFTPDNTVSVLLGIGDGAFAPRADFTVNSAPEWVTVGDLDGDQRLDVAVVHVAVEGVISVLRGNGDGTFQNHEDYATGGSPRHVTTGDLNRDGMLDLATANYFENSVSVLINSGTVTGVENTEVDTGAPRLTVSPNPVVSAARLHVQVRPGERVTAHLFDARGSLVASVFNGIATSGSFSIPWDGRGANGVRLSSGVYYLRLRTGASVISRAVVLAR